jgi:hypothetical protein
MPDREGASSPPHRPGRERAPKDLLVHPAQERAVELDRLLTRDVGQDRPALPFVHQVPHGRDRRLATAFVGHLGLIGDEVKLTPSMTEATLLDFMATHGELAGMDGEKCNRSQPPPSTI